MLSLKTWSLIGKHTVHSQVPLTLGRPCFTLSKCQRIEPKVPQTEHVAEERCELTSGFSQCQNTLPLKETVQPKTGFPSVLVGLFRSHTSDLLHHAAAQVPGTSGERDQ